MTIVVVSLEAESDLDEIENWTVENWGPAPAAEIIEAISNKIALLSDNPLVGAPRQDFGPNVRMIPARPYVIYYEVGQFVVVLRILQAARDRDTIMSGKED